VTGNAFPKAVLAEKGIGQIVAENMANLASH